MGRFNVNPVEKFDAYLKREACWIKKTLRMCQIYLKDPLRRRNHINEFSWLELIVKKIQLEYEQKAQPILCDYEETEKTLMSEYQTTLEKISREHEQSDDTINEVDICFKAKEAHKALKFARQENENRRDHLIQPIDEWKELLLKHAILAINTFLTRAYPKKTVYFLGVATTREEMNQCSLAITLLDMIINKKGNRFNPLVDNGLLEQYMESLSNYLEARRKQDAEASRVSNRYCMHRI